MIRRLLRLTLWAAAVVGAGYLVLRLRQGHQTAAVPTSIRETASTSQPVPAESPTKPADWVLPDDGTCPSTHIVKAKLSSKIFHLPGMANYDRTSPDRCYVSPEAAEADGLRAAKR